MSLLKGTVRSYNAGAGTAEVELVGSHGQYVTVPVATDLDSKTVVAGKKCAVLSFDDRDSGDAVLVATYDDTFLMGSAPLADHDHTGDTGDGGQLEADLALLATGDAATKVLTPDGANAVQWADVPVHASRHQNAGADEVSVAGLSGLLADGQTPLDHDHTGDAGDGGQLVPGTPVGIYLNMPLLLAYWPGSVIDSSIGAGDLGRNGLHLTGHSGYFAVYADSFSYFYIDAAPRYWTHADNANLDYAWEWSMGCAVRFTTASASQEVLMVKGDGSAAATSYMLSRESDGKLRFAIGDGTDLDANIKTASVVSLNTWLIVQCKYYTSGEVTIIVNDVKATNTTAIPVGMSLNAESFGLGANPDGSSPADAVIQLRDAWISRLKYSDALFDNLFQWLRAFYGV